MRGFHITAEAAGCRRGTPALIDVEALRTLCLQAVHAAGLVPVGECFHSFAPEGGEPRGATGVVLLAESHVAVHTWPELDTVTLDVFVCHRRDDNSARAEAVVQAMLAAFAPQRVARRAHRRGIDDTPIEGESDERASIALGHG